MPGSAAIAILAPGVISAAPLPKRWRRRGRFHALPAQSETELLAHAFGLDTGAIAAAPLHYLAITGRPPGGFCQYLYPVYLHARRAELILMAGADFEPDAAEAQAIIERLRQHYPQWRIERLADGRWFLISDGTPDLTTTPLETVLGEDINAHLPRGADAMHWLRILNEMQMILFDAPVNEAREAAGRAPLNSLWFWGGGHLPALEVRGWQRLVTDNPVAFGIGQQAGLDSHWRDAAGPGLDSPGTLHVYAGRPAGLDASLWPALRRQSRRGALARLTLIEPGHGELQLDARALRRGWLW